MRVTILDYGVGNLQSVAQAMTGTGAEVRTEREPLAALDTDALVLPGVGAFGPAARRLELARPAMLGAIDAGLPVLGICLGMQLLFEGSDEGPGDGLGVFRGRATLLDAKRRPQVGWNAVEAAADPLFTASDFRVGYYANSFVCRALDATDVVARSTHESDSFAAAVRRRSCVGVQFHPEKSGAPGIRFIESWLREVRSVTARVPSPGVAR